MSDEIHATVVRAASIADAGAIGSLIIDELGYVYLDSDHWADRFQRITAHDDYRTYIAHMDGKVVGYIGMQRCIAYEMDDCYLRIIALAVSSEYQRMGIGKELLRYAEQFALDNGIHHIALNSGTARTDAHAFYERNGYAKNQYGFTKTIER